MRNLQFKYMFLQNVRHKTEAESVKLTSSGPQTTLGAVDLLGITPGC